MNTPESMIDELESRIECLESLLDNIVANSIDMGDYYHVAMDVIDAWAYTYGTACDE